MPEIVLEKRVVKSLKKLPNKDRDKIESKIDTLEKYPDIENLWVKKLNGKYGDKFCLKVGDFRIKFIFDNKKIFIVDIDNRKDSYKK